MGRKSAIEWTDDTDNVITLDDGEGGFGGWFCEKVSPGCQFCYAESLALNSPWHETLGLPYKVTEDVPLKLRRDKLEGWARQTRPRRHFVNSMTDTFMRHVPDEWLYEIFDAMIAAPMQTFQVLTKRGERMADFTTRYVAERGLDELPENIWLMVSAENQEWYDNRVPHLLRTPARVRGLSLEPLIGPIHLHDLAESAGPIWAGHNPLIDWVIVGGESGTHARPMHPNWVRDIRDQCLETGVPFFFKQAGSVLAKQWGCSDTKGGNLDEFPDDLKYREFPGG